MPVIIHILSLINATSATNTFPFSPQTSRLGIVAVCRPGARRRPTSPGILLPEYESALPLPLRSLLSDAPGHGILHRARTAQTEKEASPPAWSLVHGQSNPHHHCQALHFTPRGYGRPPPLPLARGVPLLLSLRFRFRFRFLPRPRRVRDNRLHCIALLTDIDSFGEIIHTT